MDMDVDAETDRFISATSISKPKSDLVKDYEDLKNPMDSESHVGYTPNGKSALARPVSPENLMSLKYKVFRTICIILGHIGMGLSLELAGPTLQDMMTLVDGNYEEISRGLSSKMVGVMVTAPLAGILTDIFSRHVEVVLVFGYFVSALGTAIIPWSGTLSMFIAMSTVQGCSSGIVDVCHNFLILRIWGKKASSPMYALHVGFGIGALLAPQLAKPFITGHGTSHADPDTGNTSLGFTNESFWTTTALYGETETDTSQIKIPYSIAAAYVLALVPFIVFIYIYERCRFNTTPSSKVKKESKSAKAICMKGLSVFSPGNCTGGKPKLGVVFFALFFWFYLSIVGGERAFHTLLYSYAVDGPFSFSKDKAANLNSAFWFSFLAGRFLSIFVAIKIPAHIFMFILVSMTGVSTLLLVIFGATQELLFWIGTSMYGLFMAPLYPAGGAWANLHVEMKGIATAIMTLGAGSGATIYHWIAGYFFEYHGPTSLMKIVFANGVIVWLSFLALYLVAQRLGKRFTTPADLPEMTNDQEMEAINS